MSVPLPIGVELVVVVVAVWAATGTVIREAGSLSASIPARLMRVEPEGFLRVPLMVEAMLPWMLPRWVPNELRGLEPRAVLKVKLFIPALEALRAA